MGEGEGEESSVYVPSRSSASRLQGSEVRDALLDEADFWQFRVREKSVEMSYYNGKF